MIQEVEQKILDCLVREYPKDLSIEEIATRTGIHRNTISKYMWGLEKEGKVAISRVVGRAKMYVISKK
jgi:DNA-binding IclR family transcriptional regulator